MGSSEDEVLEFLMETQTNPPTGLPSGNPEPKDGEGSQKPPRKHRNRPCGAEVKRRKKARKLAQALASGKSGTTLDPPSGNPTGLGHSVVHPGNPRAGRQESRAPGARATASGTGGAGGVGRPAPKGVGQTQPPRAGRGQKRVRSDGSTPPTGARSKKRTRPPKESTKSSYAKAAANHLRVAIINRRHPLGKLTGQQAEQTQSFLHEALDKFLFTHVGTSSEIVPTFSGMRHAGEILRINCDNDASLTWLRNTTGTFLIDGALLEVVPVENLPRLTKLSLWIPEPEEERGNVLRRLEVQNPDLQVRDWCHFGTTPGKEGQLLLMGIGEADARSLKNRDGKLKYRFATLTAKLAKTIPETGAMEVEEDPGEGSSKQNQPPSGENNSGDPTAGLS